MDLLYSIVKTENLIHHKVKIGFTTLSSTITTIV